MSETEDIQIQRTLLDTYRRRLRHQILQQVKLGTLSPFSLEEEIQEAYIQIVRIKENLRAQGVSVDDDLIDIPGPGALDKERVQAPNVQAVLAARRAKLVARGWREGEAYKDTLIIPIPHAVERINRRELRPFVERNTIRLAGSGGPVFPHSESQAAFIDNVADGCELIDADWWPYQDWFFQAWSFSTDGTFYSRASFLEDHSRKEKYRAKFMQFAWMLQDIVRPILFTKSLLNEVSNIAAVEIHFFWGGMDQRCLLDDRSGFGILDAAKCQQPEIVLSTRVAHQSDLHARVRNLADEVIWLCNWQEYNKHALDHDITTMLNGKFPA